MRIVFKNLTIKNFMSFGDANVELDNQGYVLIGGKNNNPLDSAKSNGSGKSSIWNALAWALTGETVNGSKDIKNLFSNDGARVELEFELDKDTYKLIRTKDDKELGTNLKIYVNGVDKSGKGIRDSEKLLKQYLPELTSSLLNSVVILGQGLPQRFSNNTPSGRKEVLEKLSKSDFMIEEIKEKLANRKTHLLSENKLFGDTLLVLSSKKEALTDRVEDITYQLETLSKIEDIEAEIDNAKKSLEELDEYIEGTKIILSQKQELLSMYKEESTRLNYEADEIRNSIESKKVLQTSELEARKKEISFECKNNFAKIGEYEKSMKSNICPYCKRPMDDHEHIDHTKDIEELKKLNKSLLQENSNLSNEISKVCSSLEEEMRGRLSELDKKKEVASNNLFDTNQEVNKANSLLKSLELQYRSYNNALIRFTSEKENYLERKNSLQNSLKETSEEVEKLSQEILYNTNEKEIVDKSLEVVNKMITIATRDFRGFLLLNIISCINNKAKEYCKKVFNTDKLNVVLDGNNIDINFCGKSYEGLSGGEKQKIDIILQFSIRDMLSSYCNFSSNILVLDEVLDFIDAQGSDKVIDLISSISDVSSLFFISHHDEELNIPYDKMLTVVKGEDCISRIG